MARIIPFAALRPDAAYARQVAALPYDVMSTEEAREMAKGNPYCFLRVDKAEIEFPPGMAFNDPAVYQKTRANLDKLAQDGILKQDAAPCLYLYRLTANGRAQTGLGVCVPTEDYFNDKIKKHELTRADKEQDRIDHIKACQAHTGPIFLTYRAEADIQALVDGWASKNAPVYDFVTQDGATQQLWVIDDAGVTAALVKAFEAVGCLYIADGHHRSAAACKSGGSDKFLAVIFPHDQLAIMDYNRVVKDLNGLTPQAFLQALARDFIVEKVSQPLKPAQTHQYGLYLGGEWYSLRYQHTPPADEVERLAVSVLQDKVLSPILGIQDPRTDKRIDFVGGVRGTAGLTARVDSSEMACAFTVCPTHMTELMAIADAGRIMPPKSTWFEPKLLSGLLIHRF
jgi:uncharacterized protein (DUF1015 family)